MHPTSRLPSRATLFVVAFLPSQLCACVCHVCACAQQTSVCAKCAGVQGRAGLDAGARACRGCPILSILSRHAVGKRGGVVSTGAHACFPQPHPSRSRVQGAVLWITPCVGWIMDHTLNRVECWAGGHAHWASPSRNCGVTLIGLALCGVTLIRLTLVERCAGSRSSG